MTEPLHEHFTRPDGLTVDLYCGDCLDVLPTLGKVDVVITDPVYGINFAGQPTKWQRLAGQEPQDWDKTPSNVSSLLGVSDRVVIWGGNYFDLPVSRGWIGWIKPDAPPSMGTFEMAWTSIDDITRHIVVSIASTNKERVGHPTQKPLRVMTWCVERYSMFRETILDPFMGSGTTGVAAVSLGRSFIGVEIEPKYYAIARRRILEALAQPALFQV